LTVMCVILGIVISLVYKYTLEKQKQAELELSNVSAYQNRIIELSSEVESLNKTKEELENKLEIYENGTNDETLEALQQENDLLKKFACLTDVIGEGIVITLNYDDANNVVYSASLMQSLINELKASSAQAISINGERIISMSEIRAVSNYLVINGNYYYAPYTISVIGNATSLESSMEVSIVPQFEKFFQTYGGSISYIYENNISITAFDEELIESRTNLLFE
ncbi:MAG: DUF881 domain-containing protein, partial [Clostridia bacterium]|nr:DUF881 domain-containing protein [Clostridia bacterium]